ncbi:SARP family transcriptional regulator [Virgisporangium aliadipatigenens]|uniref:SARP family transcriptional regulator n=1 Tax=Virgisporangium aliadipatigenens TaxID=741659 RepID=A0A8J3YHY6_9ACTN|nr:BTAD domain-containing putative transcriptional regulator [Virgisporangium aliadipatigenens]GIJ44647.1 SARP family transcriptional regulator [Virgisporangium aliadipatigenens]
MTEDTVSLDAAVRDSRIRAGLTQHELAHRAGISVRALRDIEQGRVSEPRPASRRRLAQALGLTDLALPVRGAAAPTWTVGVLGPVAVRTDGRLHSVGSAARRTLLGLLALRPNAAVPVDEIVDVLWPEHPPRTSRNLVHGHVTAVRGLLRAAGDVRVERAGDGYRLDAPAHAVDAALFEDLLARAATAFGRDAAEDALRCYGEALDVWRGRAVADAGASLRQHPTAVALVHRRLDAALRFADLALRLGRPAASALQALLAEEPLHEALAARLMTALAGAGEQSAALATYDTMRRRLADELGVEPGPDLRAAHLKVLRQEVPRAASGPVESRRPDPVAVRPAQLPAPTALFVGRDGQLDELNAGLDDGVPSVITGPAGVGKTTLALHWLHGLAERFPDGQLYVNLRGFDRAGKLRPEQAVRGFLQALGVPPERVPADADGQVNLYRSLLAGRRMIVLLDNASDAEQVRPLMPGAPGCLVAVTSRNRLPSLVAAEGARPVPVDLLTVAESRRLLRRRLGAARADAEPDALDEIVDVAARLPLALGIAAALARQFPQKALRELVAEMRAAGSGLDALPGWDDATDLRAVFSWSYHALSPAAANLFRLLGAQPARDLGADAAAALVGAPPETVRPALAELVRAHLVTEDRPGRYGFHDLLRAYAAELSAALDPPGAVVRLLDHYLAAGRSAAEVLYPRGAGPATGRPEEALAWFRAEHHALLALLDHVGRHRLDSYAGDLARAFFDFLDRQGHWHDLLWTHEIAAAAAGRLGDLSAQARAHRSRATAWIRLGHFEAAAESMAQALSLFTAAGDDLGVAQTLVNRSGVAHNQGRYADALDDALRGLEIVRAGGHRREEAIALNAVGWHQTKLGRFADAVESGTAALELYRRNGDNFGAGNALDSLGYAHHNLGEYARAADCYTAALELFAQVGDRYGGANTRTHLGDTYHARGDVDAARESWAAALSVLEELEHPDAARVRARLARPV